MYDHLRSFSPFLRSRAGLCSELNHCQTGPAQGMKASYLGGSRRFVVSFLNVYMPKEFIESAKAGFLERIEFRSNLTFDALMW